MLAEAEGILESLTDQLVRRYHDAIEQRLRELVAGGVSVERLTLIRRPDGADVIVIDHVTPDTVFELKR